jgi:hypothetical protein
MSNTNSESRYSCLTADQREVVKTIDAAAKLHGLSSYSELLSSLMSVLALSELPLSSPTRLIAQEAIAKATGAPQ